jgi:hypothetical protein
VANQSRAGNSHNNGNLPGIFIETADFKVLREDKGAETSASTDQIPVNYQPGISPAIRRIRAQLLGKGDCRTSSRELSVKVFAGQANLIRLGFRQGGVAGFGLRRVLVDHSGTPKATLSQGEHKSIATDRVILVPGPEDEVAIVRDVYRLFVDEGQPEREIAEQLNKRGIQTDLNRPWTRGSVHQLLINEKYIGNNVWGKTSYKLKNAHVRNAPDEWIRADGVFSGIIDPVLFERAQTIIAARSDRLTDEHTPHPKLRGKPACR